MAETKMASLTVDVRTTGTGKAVSELGTVSDSVKTLNGQTVKTNIDSNTTNGISKLSSSLTGIIAKVSGTIVGVKNIGSAISSAFTNVSDYYETVNLFEYSMGQFAEQASAYANKVSSLMGIDTTEWMQGQGTFMQMARGYGMSADNAYALSKAMTELSYDYASFFNADYASMLQKFQSALSGQSRALRQYGADLTVTNMQEYATAQGISTAVSSMTQQQKAILRLSMIMNQSKNISGDLARTLTSPENELKVFSALASQAGRALGYFVLAIARNVLPWLQALAIAIRNVFTKLASFFGIDIPKVSNSITLKDTASNTKAISDNLDSASGSGSNLADSSSDTAKSTKKTTKAVKELKRQLAGFDKLNVLTFNKDSTTSSSSTPSSGSSGGTGGTGGTGGGTGGGEDLWNKLFPNGTETGFLDSVTDTLGDKVKVLTQVFKIVSAIGLAFVGWNIIKKILAFVAPKASFFSKLESGTYVNKLKDFVLYYGSEAKNALTKAFPSISTLFETSELSTTFGFIASSVAGVVAFVAVLVGRFKSLVTNGETFKNGIKAIISFLGSIVDVIGGIISTVSGIWDDVVEKVGLTNKDLDNMADVLTIIVGIIMVALGVINPIFAVLGAIVLAIEGVILVVKLIGSYVESISNSPGFQRIKEIVVNFLKPAIAEIKQAVYSLFEAIANLWVTIKPFVAFLGKILGVVVTIVAVVAGGVVLALIRAGSIVLQVVLGIITGIINAISTIIKFVVKIVKKINDFIGLTDTIKGAWERIKGFFKGIKKIWDAIFGDDNTSKTNKNLDKTSKKTEKISENLSKNKKVKIGTSVDTSSLTKTLKKNSNKKIKYTADTSSVTKATSSIKNKKASVTYTGKQTTSFKKASKSFKSIKSKTAEISANIKKKGKFDKYKKQYDSIKSKSASANVQMKVRIPNFSVSLKKVNKKYVPDLYAEGYKDLVKIGRFANGGFPNQGQLFIANEAGAEMVGSIGGSTAVANNDQIVNSVSMGVASAVKSVLSSGSSSSNAPMNIVLNFDGEAIAKSTINYANGQTVRYGVSPILT